MKLPKFSARNLAYAVDAHIQFPDDPVSGVRKLIEGSDVAANRLVKGAVLLKLINDEGHVSEMASLIPFASLVERRELVRFYLERFEPYRLWKRKVDQGFDPLEAARQVKLVEEIDETAADIRDWFLDLAVHCGSVREVAMVVFVRNL